jgi:hypothetical protein
MLTERLLTEKSIDRTPFGRIPFDQKVIKPIEHLTERHLTEKKIRIIWPNTLSTKKVI